MIETSIETRELREKARIGRRGRLRRLVLTFAGTVAFFSDALAFAQTPVPPPSLPLLAYRDIVAVESPLIVVTSQGERLRLAGVCAPEPERLSAPLASILQGQRAAWLWPDFARDRRGRFPAHLQRSDGLWIQAFLVDEGLAVVMPLSGETEGTAELLRIEASARRDRRGLWQDQTTILRTEKNIENLPGVFRVVESPVVRAARVGDFIYLNSGADWRHDFTVAIPAKRLKTFQTSGKDVLSWEGRRIRVRGWLRSRNGPMIEATLPEVLELLPD